MKEKTIGVLALFTSTGTLLCCVLPAVVAAVAGGAAVGAMITAFPWLIPLSANKGWVFLIAGGLISIDALLIFRPQSQIACQITNGKGCEVTGRFSRLMLRIAIAIYSLGLFFAYALVPIMDIISGG